MTPEQQRIADVIAKDATGRHYLYHNELYCVLGGLAHEMGVSDAQLVQWDHEGHDQLRVQLGEKYGLTSLQCSQLMRTNDLHPELWARREALTEAVQGFTISYRGAAT